MKKILVIMLSMFLFSCVNKPLSETEMLTGSWEYISKENEPVEAQLDFNSDMSYKYTANTGKDNFVQTGMWKLTEHGEIEILLERVVKNNKQVRLLNVNHFINIVSLTRGHMLLRFGKDKEYRQEFHKID